MIKAIIVDDELGARESLSKMIEKNCKQIEVVAKVAMFLTPIFCACEGNANLFCNTVFPTLLFDPIWKLLVDLNEFSIIKVTVDLQLILIEIYQFNFANQL